MKEQYIAVKKRWTRKMAGKEEPALRSHDRLPPGFKGETAFFRE